MPGHKNNIPRVKRESYAGEKKKKKNVYFVNLFCEFGTFSKSSIENQGQITLTFFFELKNFWTLIIIIKTCPNSQNFIL